MHMSIYDLEICNGIITRTDLHQQKQSKQLTMTAKDVEQQLIRLSYTGGRRIKDEVVERFGLPIFAPVFFDLVYTMDRIPTEEEFVKAYLYFFVVNERTVVLKKEFCKQPSPVFSLEGVTARLLRSYPSLIRDLHFFLLASESGSFDCVFYSLRTDLLRGFDLIVSKSNHKMGVSLFTDTKRAHEYKEKKYKRHNYKEDLKELIIALDLNQGQAFGAFRLFSAKHVDLVNQEMNSCA